MVLGRARLNRLLKKSLIAFANFPDPSFFAAHRASDFPGLPRPVEFASCRHTAPRAYTAGISFTSRTKLAAVASKRNHQSTRFRPRSLTWRRTLSSLPQPNTFSISFRFF